MGCAIIDGYIEYYLINCHNSKNSNSILYYKPTPPIKMPQNFLQTQIPFSQENHGSVYWAHLQNSLKKFLSSSTLSSTDNFQVDKICHVLNDIYSEYMKLEKSFHDLSGSTKNMMQEFSDMLGEFKDDREKLLDATKDKFQMLTKVKEYSDNLTQLEVENRILKETVDQLKEINQLLTEKGNVLEDQLENRKMAQVGSQSFQRISQQYDRLLQSNSEIRKQLIKICGQSESIQKISKPIQIINKAIKSNPKLKQELWRSAQETGSSEFLGLQRQFYRFNFDQFIQEIRNQSVQ